MLKPKLKPCKKCSKDCVVWADGMCSACANTGTGFKKTNSVFPRKAIKSQLKKVRKRKPGNKEFFQDMANLYQDMPISFESGKNIGTIGTVNLAHIFPKEIYKSVAHEYLNIILLSWEEHTRFDELLNRHDFEKLETEFKSWDKICKRIIVLLPLCTENGKLRLALEKHLKQE